jgi:multidrug efflux pump subunit AcrB
LNFVRTRLVTVQGAGIPYPFGGKTPQVMYDLDTGAMQALGAHRPGCRQRAGQSEPADAGGHRENRRLRVQRQPQQRPVEGLGPRDLPIKSVNGSVVYMHDVAQVHNGSAVQTNIVHVDGNRSVLLSVFKNGATSTLDIVGGVKKMLDVIKPSLPDALEVKPIGDQSMFVRASINGVVREGSLSPPRSPV